jgi:RimJ/RimL family protein N-acetyltransferase
MKRRPTPTADIPIYLHDLGWRDALALYRLATQPGFFYAYLHEPRQPVWRNVLRFLWLQRSSRGHAWFKAVRHGTTHRLLGCVMLRDFGRIAPHTAEIAYFIAAPWQGRGLCARAVMSVAHWSQQTLAMRGLYATIAQNNQASLAIAARLGLAPHKYLAAAESGFTDQHGAAQACWIMQSTPQSFANALKIWRAPQVPIRSGATRSQRQQRLP